MVKIKSSVDELAERLSIAGFEVESLEDLSSNADGVVVGYIEKKDIHPNADKLSICQVNIGLDQNLQIVCGASNVKSGIYVPVATVGTNLPAKNLKIKRSKLRGVDSEGMICSKEEIGLKSDIDGICILDEIAESLPSIGEPVDEFFGLNDFIIELAITANRPDGMSIIGIANEISALTNTAVSLPKWKKELKFNNFTNKSIAKNIGENEIYSLTLIEGLNGSISSDKIINKRLEVSGIRSINAIVDITNYVMLEQGQPLHAFDADLLEDITNKKVDKDDFGIRNATKGEKFITLDDRELTLNENCQLITCHDYPIALAGVIGGKQSAVNKHTKRIWLEAAVFSPARVRSTSRSIGIRTESSSRFEKGIPSEITLESADRANYLISKIMGSSAKESWVNERLDNKDVSIKLRRSKIHNLLGTVLIEKEIKNNTKNSYREIEDYEIENSLSCLGCILNKNNHGWDVKIPPRRKSDLTREVDLIEEIARIIGYDKFCVNLPNPLKPGLLIPRQIAERYIRDQLSSIGLQEVTTFSLVSNDKLNEYSIPIKNPLLAETSHLRTSLWAEHLNICSRNLNNGRKGCWIYEIGRIYKKSNQGIEEEKLLSGVLCGENRMEKWTTSGKSRFLDYFEARGKLETVFMKLNVEVIDRKNPNIIDYLHPGVSANLTLEGRGIGIFGQIHPQVAKELSLQRDIYIFEIKLDPLLDSATRKNKWKPNYKAFNTNPFLERDISLVVSKSTETSKIIEIIRKYGRPILENVELIDRFQGGSLKDTECSQTFRLFYRHKDKTLKEEDILTTHEMIRSKLISTFDAVLRS